MADSEGMITEDINAVIAPYQEVYDKQGQKVGTVDEVDEARGYLTVETNPFSERELVVPFELITSIDGRELFLSVSKDELYRDYATPPPRTRANRFTTRRFTVFWRWMAVVTTILLAVWVLGVVRVIQLPLLLLLILPLACIVIGAFAMVWETEAVDG